MKNRTHIFGIPFHVGTMKAALSHVNKILDGGKSCITTTPNAEILLTSLKNPSLYAVLKKSSLNIPDTVSLLWAENVLNKKWGMIRSVFELLFLPIRKHFWKKDETKFLKETVCGSDIVIEISALAATRGDAIVFLGSQKGVAKKAAQILQKKYPSLKISALCGSAQEGDDTKMQKFIQKSGAKIVFVAFGCPKQELWIERNIKHCPKVRMMMGIGGSFDFIVGKIKRAPILIRKLGLEWFYRFIQEPSRIFRIVQAVVVFPYKVFYISLILKKY
ncbi:hypothetical protein COB57_00020 [Candidatus Peregrinibacteria bacterium]|nr:MAG: hypothetical protein COB57_00020 [Candidatus Peregrinibacteria bacterium]